MEGTKASTQADVTHFALSFEWTGAYKAQLGDSRVPIGHGGSCGTERLHQQHHLEKVYLLLPDRRINIKDGLPSGPSRRVGA